MAAPMKSGMSGKKRKLENLSMDEFMMGGFESSSSESDKVAKKSKQNGGRKTKRAASVGKSNQKQTGMVSKHKVSLEKLKDQDPEFYEFLKDEDESLLQFGDMSGSDVSDMSDDDTSKSDDTAPIGDEDDDGDNDDDGEEEFPMSSDEEISTERITKFLEKKNKKEIEQKKKTLEMSKTKVSTKDKKKETEEIEKKSKGSTAEKTKVIKEQKQKIPEKAVILKNDKELKKAEQKVIEHDDDSDEDDAVDDTDDEDDLADEFDLEASDDSEEEMFHKPPEELEVMNDSDDEDDEVSEGGAAKKTGKKITVTMTMIKDWSKRFKEQASPALIHEAVYAFKAAVEHTAVEAVATKYKVEGSKVYNAVVRMCLIEIPNALQTVLDLPKTTDLQKPMLPSNKNQKWKKVHIDMKSYLADVLKLLSDLSEANMIDVLLKHVHKLVAYYACFPKLTKAVLKKCVNIWSTGEETSRVLAFLCINRLIHINQELYLENSIKQLYMAYVRNCKFTSPNMLPMINFMQRSFVEIFALDLSMAYQYAFVYIRQLAIHLRNAITTKKKESCQAVYNWQYIHCIGLWSRVLSATYPNEVLEPLIYPLVQTVVGTIKLIPTQRYYPLRFHCVQALIQISRSTRTFIPVLPFLLEVLEQTDFNKKHKSLTFKPVNFACILKFTTTQLQEKSFKDGIIDQLYELFLEHFHAHAHRIGFPELALPAVIQLKDFLKKCKVGNFTKQIKQMIDKVDDNCKFITAQRRTTNISLTDTKAVAQWENRRLEAGTPISKFYATWRKMRDRELMHRIAAKDENIDPDLPTVKRPLMAGQRATEEEKKEFSALFDSDSDENETDLTERFLPPDEKRQLKELKRRQDKNKPGRKGYEDFDSDELQQLGGSGSDDSDAEYADGTEIDDDDDEGDDDIPEGEDIVKEFRMSSDDESD